MTNFLIALIILASSTVRFCGKDIPIPEPSTPPVTNPTPSPIPSEVPTPVPCATPPPQDKLCRQVALGLPFVRNCDCYESIDGCTWQLKPPCYEPSPIPTVEPSSIPEQCFPPTEPIDGSCPWHQCLSTCPKVTNFAIYFERVTRNGKEVCRGHLGNQVGLPSCFQYVEKQGKLLPGDKISFGMSPRTDKFQKDPGTGSDACCWYGDNRQFCELPPKCPAPDGEFKFIGYTGTPCKLNDEFSITCFPANKGWKALACPKTGTPGFNGTQGCNQRLIP